jgi:hypothetical protein
MDLIGISILISIAVAGILTLVAYYFSAFRRSENSLILVKQQDPTGGRVNLLNRASAEAQLPNGIYATRFNNTKGRFIPMGRLLEGSNLTPNLGPIRNTPTVVFQSIRNKRSRKGRKQSSPSF